MRPNLNHEKSNVALQNKTNFGAGEISLNNKQFSLISHMLTIHEDIASSFTQPSINESFIAH